jgi:hypothetical protein
LYQLNRPYRISLFFGQVRFASIQLASSPPFPLPGAVSPPINVITPPRRVTLPSYWAKMSSLPPLHLSATLHPVAFPLESKLKHSIHITVIGYSPQTVRLSFCAVIKRSSQPWPLSPPLNRVSILPPPYPSELHPSSSSFSFTDVSRPSSIHTTTPMMKN